MNSNHREASSAPSIEAAYQHLSRKDFEGAASVIAEFLRISGGDHPEALCAQAYLDASCGNHNDALSTIKTLLQKNPKHVSGLFLYGQLMEATGNIHDAANAFTAASRLSALTNILSARDRVIHKLSQLYAFNQPKDRYADRIVEKKSAFLTLLEEMSAKLLQSAYLGRWLVGAIYPTELAFFMAKCEVLGVRHIIECGRQDGYSTEVLAGFVEERNGLLISIDWELDAERAAACRERLAGFQCLELVKGDAFETYPAALHRVEERPFACLFDGPKGWPAALLGLGSALNDNFKLLSMHNQRPHHDLSARLRALSHTPTSIDEHLLFEVEAHLPTWTALRNKERHLYREDAEMSSDLLTLLCLDMAEADREQLLWLNPPGRRDVTPWLIRILSRLGHAQLVGHLLGSTM